MVGYNFSMTFLQSIILGAVQGLTEFLPISSSAHLLIAPKLLGLQEGPLYFDLILHLGTVAALVLFFWEDLLGILMAIITDFGPHKFSFAKYSKKAQMGFIIALGCVPAVLFGLVFNNYIENNIRDIKYVSLFLAIGSILMFVAEQFFNKVSSSNLFTKLTYKKGLLIGVFQALALLPGISRSGSTISSGMFFGLSREEAAKFSFLLSVPIVVMAAVFELVKSAHTVVSAPVMPMIGGFLSSFIVGVMCIRFLLDYVKNRSLHVFVVYRLVLIFFLLVYIN